MVGRSTFIHEADTAFTIFQDNIAMMRPFYNDFFPELKAYTACTLKAWENID